MTDLERFRAEDPPRSDALVQRYRRHFWPLLAMIMWGIVYAFFSPLPALAVGFAGAKLLLPPPPADGATWPPSARWSLALLAVLVVVAYVAGWLWFAALMRRVRAHRGGALREGRLIPAVYLRSRFSHDEGGPLTHDLFRFRLNERWYGIEHVRRGHPTRPSSVDVVALVDPAHPSGAVFFDGRIAYVPRFRALPDDDG